MTTPRQALEKLLHSLGNASPFVTDGNYDPVLPGLDVEGVGVIGCPISANDAKKLIRVASQAPYGRGEETVVDTGVRRVWQIGLADFAIRNPQWNRHVEEIVEAVRIQFQIKAKVTASLYKLLVYEKGSFFKPHRDTEKESRMFGTLVICLPSRHEGGTLIVRHDGQTKSINFGGSTAEFRTQYAAFYADCQHEITPVTSGYRICLVYNLAVQGAKKPPSAPHLAGVVEKLASHLRDLFSDSHDGQNRIAVPLKHQYSEAGVDLKNLKGSDRTCMDVLAQAAQSLDYACYLALLSVYESGAPDYGTIDFDRGSYGRKRPRGWYHDDDFDDEDLDDDMDDDSLDAEFEEIFDAEIRLDHWFDPQGGRAAFGNVHLDEAEILNAQNKEQWLVKQEIHEATGNEGATMNRWYRRAVVVIWPRDRTLAILAKEGPATALPELERLARGAKKPEALAACRAFAAKIIDFWKANGWRERQHGLLANRLLRILTRIGTVDLARRFLAEPSRLQANVSTGLAIARLCRRFGWTAFASEIRGFAVASANHRYQNPTPLVTLYEGLCRDRSPMTADRQELCRIMADELARAIDQKRALPQTEWQYSHAKQEGVVAGAVRIYSTAGATVHLRNFLSWALTDNSPFDLHEVLIPDVRAIYEWLPQLPAARPAADHIRQHCLDMLRAATAHPVTPPKDWAREGNSGCACADCRALSRFLAAPDQETARFPLSKKRRQHLHQQIDSRGLDCTHVTERRGSPYTLVCKKTTQSHVRRKKQYEVDRKLLAVLERLGGPQKRVKHDS
jgi:predicted 2-oxoglutarate/Fe(II)-dependent dioxygenase YbiX